MKKLTMDYSSSNIDVTLPDGRDERLDTFTNKPSRGAGDGERLRLLLFLFFFLSSSLVVSELLDDELLELLERVLDGREPSLDFEAAEVLELELLVELADLLRDLTIL